MGSSINDSSGGDAESQGAESAPFKGVMLQLFRFSAAVVLVVAVSLVSIAQEKRQLDLTRAISLQQYRTDELLERRAHLRLHIHELKSPAKRTGDGEPVPPSPQTTADATVPGT